MFRDIKGVGQRKVKKEEPGWKLLDVEQLGELRVLWIRRTFSTFLEVEEDQRDPEKLVTDFRLQHSVSILGCPRDRARVALLTDQRRTRE